MFFQDDEEKCKKVLLVDPKSKNLFRRKLFTPDWGLGVGSQKYVSRKFSAMSRALRLDKGGGEGGTKLKHEGWDRSD